MDVVNLKQAVFRPVEPEKLASLDARLSTLSQCSGGFLVLSSGSTVIATLGLLLNSPAIVIGAMIIAPLMGPLVGMSLASLRADTILLRRATMTLVAGSLIGALIAYIVGLLFHSNPFTPEILSRIRPTLLDLGVACFAGAIGAYCQTKEELSDTVAGVAVAVALVPPLGVIGIGLAMNIRAIWTGALWLYVTNLLGIAFAGVVVFLVMGYRPTHHVSSKLILTGTVLCLMMIPLGYSMHELFLENELSRRIPAVLQEKTDRFKDIELRDLQVRRFLRPTRVVATVYGSENTVTPLLVKEVQGILVRETGTPIDFRVRVVPSTEIRALESLNAARPEPSRVTPSIAIKAVVVTPSGKTVKPILLPTALE